MVDEDEKMSTADISDREGVSRHTRGHGKSLTSEIGKLRGCP